MATKYWLGTAEAVAQVVTVQVTSFDASTSYRLTVGDEILATQGTTDIATTVAAMVSNWNASTHPYFTGITAAATGSPVDTVQLTADTAGVPFTVTESVSGGTGTIGSATTATANSGPNDWSIGENWSDGSIPATNDTIIIANNSVHIAWGLDQSAVDNITGFFDKTYQSNIGLEKNGFATSADGQTRVSTAEEYRDTYLKIGWTSLTLGRNTGTGSAAGSLMLKLHNDRASASTTRVIDTRSSGQNNLPSVRFLFDNADAELYVLKSPGGVGVAADEPGETSNVKIIDVSDSTSASRMVVGDGVTFKASGGKFQQNGGVTVFSSADVVETMNMRGGEIDTNGDFEITTLTTTGGTMRANHTSSASPAHAIGTLNLNDGTVDGRASGEARTWNIVNLNTSGSLKANDAITINTLNEPTDPYTLTMGS